MTPVDKKITARIDKWHCIKLKYLCTAKEIVTGVKKQPT
jgi:hypothetical protein